MPTTAAQRASHPEPEPPSRPNRPDGRHKAYVETYGCQMNISDSELMEGVLVEAGYEIVQAAQHADVVLINTCAIREHAEQRVIGRVGQLQALRRDNPDLLIGVTGCMAQRLGDAFLKDSRQLDLVMGPDGYRALPEALRRIRDGGQLQPAVKKKRTQLAVLDLDPAENYQGLTQRHTSSIAAWIPVQRGCDHRCTFCIVPYVRGPEKNRSAEEVLAEVAQLAGRGLTEITLLGQTVNSYSYEEWSFPDLLRAVALTPGVRRVRFTSPHPNDVTDALIDVMVEESAVCEHLHLPVQAGSDRTLRRMLRRYTVADIMDVVDRVRGRVPDMALSTDVIAAFPGETEAEFEATLALMREVRFDEAFTYKYSLRAGTPAARLPEKDFIDPEVAQARLERLIDCTRAIQAEINESEVGRVEEVLVERPAKGPGQMMGRTRRAKVVAFPATDSALVGRYVRVELTDTTGSTFRGRLS